MLNAVVVVFNCVILMLAFVSFKYFSPIQLNIIIANPIKIEKMAYLLLLFLKIEK